MLARSITVSARGPRRETEDNAVSLQTIIISKQLKQFRPHAEIIATCSTTNDASGKARRGSTGCARYAGGSPASVPLKLLPDPAESPAWGSAEELAGAARPEEEPMFSPTITPTRPYPCDPSRHATGRDLWARLTARIARFVEVGNPRIPCPGCNAAPEGVRRSVAPGHRRRPQRNRVRGAERAPAAVVRSRRR